MKRKFKVGDRVRVRSWEDMEKEFGGDWGMISCNCGFTDIMQRELKNLTATITVIEKDDIIKLFNWSDGKEHRSWNYSTDMFELVSKESDGGEQCQK